MIPSAALNELEVRALEVATGGGGLPSRIQAFDLNLAEAELLLNLGLSPDDVAQVRSMRPFYQVDDIGVIARVGVDTDVTLRRFFTVSQLCYLDPTTQQWNELRADTAEWIVPEPAAVANDAEAAGSEFDGWRRVRFVRRVGRPEWTDVESAGGRPFPSFVDGQGQRRHLHPEFVQVQARCKVDDEALRDLLQTLGLRVHQTFPLDGLFTARVGDGPHGLAALSGALLALNAAPCIEIAEPAWLGFDDVDPDPARETVISKSRPTDAETDASVPWNLDLLRVPSFWSVSRGSPAVTLVCIDSGASLDHPSLATDDPAACQTLQSYAGEDPVDRLGHGTHVATMLVGNGYRGVWGVAPGCSLKVLKVSLEVSTASYPSRRAALMSLVPLAKAGHRLVMNLSWRTTGDVALIRAAIGELAAAGALIVCSSGNESLDGDFPHFPSDYSETLSVGALGPDGRRALKQRLAEGGLNGSRGH
jgi:hypothetical protein